MVKVIIVNSDFALKVTKSGRECSVTHPHLYFSGVVLFIFAKLFPFIFVAPFLDGAYVKTSHHENVSKVSKNACQIR